MVIFIFKQYIGDFVVLTHIDGPIMHLKALKLYFDENTLIEKPSDVSHLVTLLKTLPEVCFLLENFIKR